MKRLFFVIFILGITLTGFAEIKPKEMAGEWKYKVDTGSELMTGVFKFIEKDGELTGEIVSDDGYTIPFSKIEFKENNNLHLEAKTDNDFIKVDIKIEGMKFSGMGANYEGEAPISGEKTSE
jgi:hypothetical protein